MHVNINYIKKSIKLLLAPFFWIVYFLSGFISRREDLHVFGATGGKFSDNSKYLFLKSLNIDDGIRKIWISSNAVTVCNINKAYGMVAFKRSSLRGLYYQVLASKYFFNCYVSDVNFWLSRGAKKINLWHGFPLKKIEYDIDNGNLANVYNPKSKWEKFIRLLRYIINPAFLTPPDFIYNNKNGYDKIFSSAFRVTNDVFLRFESPRVSYLKSKKNRQNFKKGSILYLPTMRESYTGNWLEDVSLIDFDELNKVLDKHSIGLDVKLHPNENLKFNIKYNHLTILNSDIDVYEILGTYDLLITDYSSVAFDAFEIDLPVVLYWPDHSAYMETTRGFYFDLIKIFGKKCVTDLKTLASLIANDTLESRFVNSEIAALLSGLHESSIK